MREIQSVSEELLSQIQHSFEEWHMMPPNDIDCLVKVIERLSFGQVDIRQENLAESIDTMLAIWNQALSTRGLSMEINILTPLYENADKMEGFLEFGEYAGIPQALTATLIDGVPVQDIIV